MKIIFGLGNPGNQYAQNRHNVGFKILDALAASVGSGFKRSLRLNVWLAVFKQGKTQLVLVKPRTFMNNSGVCVKNVLKYYKTTCVKSLVVYDDIDLSLGVVRFKENGSAGGHHGLESILEWLNTREVSRLRIGINKPDRSDNLAQYVLSNFTNQEKDSLNQVIDRAVSACLDWVDWGPSYVMNKYNQIRS